MDDILKKEVDKVGNTKPPATVVEGIPIVRPKCSDCWLTCNWRSYFLEIDEKHLCPMLEEEDRVSFSKSSPITADNLEYYSALALDRLNHLVSKKDPREIALLHKCITEHKKVFYPEINKNVSLELSENSDFASKIIQSVLGNESPKDNEENLEKNTDSKD